MASIPINLSMLTDFGTMYSPIFHEARIRRVSFAITPLSQADGNTVFQVNEDNFGTPNFDIVTSSTSIIRCNAAQNPKSTFSVQWIARDLGNLEFISTDQLVETVAALNVYTNSTTFNSPSDARLWLVRPTMRVEFRGVGAHT